MARVDRAVSRASSSEPEALRQKVIRAIAADPRGRLLRGKAACVSYGDSVVNVGRYRQVVVLEAASYKDGGGTAVSARGRCRPIRLPAGVVLLPASGSGVLLLAAARFGATSTVRALVQNGVHVAVVDEEYNTPLHLACIESRVATAWELLDLGAIEDTLVRNVRFLTPLAIAAQHGLTCILNKVHASPGGKDFATGVLRRFPLVSAARRGDLHAVTSLLKEGRAVDAVTPERSTALSVAAEEGHLAVISLLVARRADVMHASGVTPNSETGCTRMPVVYLAAKHGHEEALAMLLRAAADPDACTSTGATALHKAAILGRQRMVQALLDAHACVDPRTSRATRIHRHAPGSTPLSFAVTSGHGEVAGALLARRADANSRSVSPAGWATWGGPLHVAALAPAAEAVRKLAGARGDPNARMGLFTTAAGLTPLMVAAVTDNVDVVEALLAVQADPGLRSTAWLLGAQGWRGTALDMARLYGRSLAVAALEAHGAGQGVPAKAEVVEPCEGFSRSI